MDLLTKNDLMTLIETEAEWCVSLYMPMVRAGAEVQQNPIRFKNLLRKAKDTLEKLGVKEADADALLQPAAAMLDDPGIWQARRADGLAVFVEPDSLQFFRLPIRPENHAIVKTRFYIKPLLPLLAGDGRFYVLALSQDEVRLLEGTRHSVNQVELEGVPDGLADALGQEEMRNYMRAVGGGGGGAIWQGSGGSTDSEKKQILRYFHRVDKGLRDLIADKQIPLVLAGVDYLLAIYREANSYPHLVDAEITGNPETLSAKDLHARAWDFVAPRFAQAQQEQRELFETFKGREDERASTSLKQTILAAHQGRIATLFVALDEQIWGHFDHERVAVHVRPEMQPGDQDLLDLLAAQTFANSGIVYAVESDAVPGDRDFAAILRY